MQIRLIASILAQFLFYCETQSLKSISSLLEFKQLHFSNTCTCRSFKRSWRYFNCSESKTVYSNPLYSVQRLETNVIPNIDIGGGNIGGGNKSSINDDSGDGDGDENDKGNDERLTSRRSIEVESSEDLRLLEIDRFHTKVTEKMKKYWKHYVFLLTYFPIMTNALTSGVTGVIGDIAAQIFETSCNSWNWKNMKWINMKRTYAVAFESLLISGPGLHILLNLLENWIPTTSRNFISISQHVVIDTVLIDPLFIATFFFVTAIFEGKDVKSEILPQFQREFGPAVRSSFKLGALLWPVEWICFKYLPLELRAASLNLSDIVWTAMLSVFSHRKEEFYISSKQSFNLTSRT